jgi:hypothetical protein
MHVKLKKVIYLQKKYYTPKKLPKGAQYFQNWMNRHTF